jgi:peptide/nickel transport system substrate-binding protein
MNRREFLNRAAAIGVSTPAVPAFLAGTPASAAPAKNSFTYSKPGAQVPELALAHYGSDAGSMYGDTARVVSQAFTQLGLRIRLNPIQFNVFVSTISNSRGVKDMAIISWGAAPYRLDPHFWLQDTNKTDARRNLSFYSNPEFDKLADAQALELDPEARRKLVYEASEVFANGVQPSWHIYHPATVTAFNKIRFPHINPIPPLGINYGLHQLLDLTPADPTHKSFVIGEAWDFSSWNVFGEGSVTRRAHHRYVYDTFTRIGYNAEVVPWAAESWKWITPTQLQVKLRSGMKWHDGKPVTVDDAVFSFNFWIKHKPPLWSTINIKNQKSVKKIDDSTFQIELVKPAASFIGVDLAFCCLIPQHIWEKLPEGTRPWEWDVIGANAVIGSGPFKFVQWRRTAETIYDRNPDHWAAPKIDRFHEIVFSSADAMAGALESQDIDAAASLLDQAAMKRIVARNPKTLELMSEPTHQAIMLMPNTSKEPFSDPAFRQALRLATPSQQAFQIAAGGFGVVGGSGPIPRPLGKWYDESLPIVPFDLNAAKKMLADAGYKLKGGRLQFPR